MSDLTIKDVQNIIGWSYPTALEFAKQHGVMDDGRWLVPFDDVAAIVQKRLVEAQRMQGRLVAAGNGSHG